MVGAAVTNAWDPTAVLPSLGAANAVKCVARMAIDAAFGVCKASFLCAALQPEVASYAACLRRVRSAAVPPPGWSPAQKRTP